MGNARPLVLPVKRDEQHQKVKDRLEGLNNELETWKESIDILKGKSNH